MSQDMNKPATITTAHPTCQVRHPRPGPALQAWMQLGCRTGSAGPPAPGSHLWPPLITPSSNATPTWSPLLPSPAQRGPRTRPHAWDLPFCVSPHLARLCLRICTNARTRACMMDASGNRRHHLEAPQLATASALSAHVWESEARARSTCCPSILRSWHLPFLFLHRELPSRIKSLSVFCLILFSMAWNTWQGLRA